jgi:hypothetical membrane protein
MMTAGWVAGGLAQSRYSWSRQEISDLGALTARHPWVWNLADSLAGLLIAVFALALHRVFRYSRTGRLGAWLVGIVGIGSVLDGVLREDCPLSTSLACQQLQSGPGLSWHHQAHDVESLVVVIASIAAPLVLAPVFGRRDDLRRLRPYSLLTGALLASANLAYLFLYGHPGAGTAQRAFTLISMAWIAVLGTALARSSPRRSRRGRGDRPAAPTAACS